MRLPVATALVSGLALAGCGPRGYAGTAVEPPTYAPPTYAPPTYAPPTYAPPTFPQPHAGAPSGPTTPDSQPPAETPPGAHSRQRSVGTVTLGPSVFGELRGTGRDHLWSPGLAIEFTSRFAFGDGGRFGLRGAWGFTAFDRFETFTSKGYGIGAWTTQAYKDVWSWTWQESWQPFRAVGGVFALVFLMMPYVVAGGAYLMAPIATTTYVELDFAGGYEFGDDGTGGVVPYVEGGLGFVGYLHPKSARPFGGLGPMVGTGVRLGSFTLGAKGTWLPPYLHGEADDSRTSVVIGTASLGVAF